MPKLKNAERKKISEARYSILSGQESYIMVRGKADHFMSFENARKQPDRGSASTPENHSGESLGAARHTERRGVGLGLTSQGGKDVYRGGKGSRLLGKGGGEQPGAASDSRRTRSNSSGTENVPTTSNGNSWSEDRPVVVGPKPENTENIVWVSAYMPHGVPSGQPEKWRAFTKEELEGIVF